MSTPKTLHLISLGSSFAAGPGIPPSSLRSASRSANNYASILASTIPAITKHTDLTISGATLSTILSEPQTFFGTTFSPQLEGVTPDADIVTLTAGGNDLGYIGGVIRDEVASRWWGGLLARWLPESSAEMSVEELAGRFENVLEAVHERAPKARVFLVEYLTVLGADAEPGRCVSMSRERVEWHCGVARRLHEASVLAVERVGRGDGERWCELVGVAQGSEGHGVESEENWVEGLTWLSAWSGNIFHPNERGMRAVAGMIGEMLGVRGGSVLREFGIEEEKLTASGFFAKL